MRIGLVTCIYNNLDKEPFKGVYNREIHYLYSVKSIARWGYNIHVFCSSREYNKINDFFKNEVNVYIHKFDLFNHPLHEHIQQIREANIELYTNKHWKFRYVEVMWGKFLFLKKILDVQLYDNLYWVDAGISYPALFPDRLNPHTTDDRFKNGLLDYDFSKIFSEESRFLTNLSSIQNNRLFFMRTAPQQSSLPKEISPASISQTTTIIGSFFGGNSISLYEFIQDFNNLAKKCIEYGELFFEQQLMTELYYRNPTKYLTYHFTDWGHENEAHYRPPYEFMYHDIYEIWGEIEDDLSNMTTNNHQLNKIISFSLFGNNIKYIQGIKKNVFIAKSKLPDWRIRIFIDSEDLDANVLFWLRGQGNVDIVDVRHDLNLRTLDKNQVFWRFIAFSEKNSLVISRDADSRFTDREVEYIKRWEKVLNKLFIIRDHPWQSKIPAGLVGVNTTEFDIASLYEKIMEAIEKYDGYYGSDQDFLEELFPNSNDDSFICSYENENFLPYGKDIFIGAQMDENDNPLCVKSVELQEELKQQYYTYNICSISIGREYHLYTKDLIDSVFKNTNPSIFTIVTDDSEQFLKQKKIYGDKLNIVKLEDGIKTRTGNNFNYNLKAYALLEDLKTNSSAKFCIYVDSDMQFMEGSDQQIMKQLSEKNEIGKPVAFASRPALLLNNKLSLDNSFFKDKIKDLPSGRFHDSSHCVNEQFLVLSRMLPYYRFFINRWLDKEEFLRLSNKNAYAEGLEIGMSLSEAFFKLRFDFRWNDLLQSYSNKTGNYHTYG